MSPCYDILSSILLCAEDNNSALGFEDDFSIDEEVDTGDGLSSIWESERSELYVDFSMDFPLLSDEHVGLLVEKEIEHLPRHDYAERLASGALDLSIRRAAIDWICEVHAHLNYGPLSAYLSVKYLDRFLGDYQLPQGKAWMTQLLSVACLSLAAKMEEIAVPSCLDIQIGCSKYVFDARTIQRMELLVLSTLKWRMQSLTPFSFIDFFLHKFNSGNAPDRSLVSRSAELILSTMKGTEFLVFRPSQIAAAIALVVLGGNQLMDIENCLSCCVPLLKEGVLKCYEIIQDMSKTVIKESNSAGMLVSTVPEIPIEGLDASCLSHKIGNAAVGSRVISHQSTRDSKRRRMCGT